MAVLVLAVPVLAQDIGTGGAATSAGQVKGTSIEATRVPDPPEIKVPLYPDASVWYTDLGEAVAFWEVPDSVTDVATAINQNPNAVPDTVETEVTAGKNFGRLNEGIWYIHVRFKNIIGWGSAASYKISIDTTKPLPFDLTIDSAASSNPSPHINFNARDAFSGIFRTTIYIDGKEIDSTNAISYTLPAQGPGKHALLVKVFDRAGNTAEQGLVFEVFPLQTPVIDFVSSSISQGELVFLSGTSLVNSNVDVTVMAKDQKVFTGTTRSDDSGNWKLGLDKALPTGKYSLTAIVRNEAGAVSYPTDEETFRIRPKIVLSLGNFINLGWFEIFIIAMLLIAAAAGLVAWWYVSKRDVRDAYRTMVSRDIEKLSGTLMNSLEELEENETRPEPRRSASMAATLGRMRETLGKFRKYVIKEVEKLK